MPYVWKTVIICSSWLVHGPMFINTIFAIVVNMKPELKWFVNRALAPESELLQPPVFRPLNAISEYYVRPLKIRSQGLPL